MLLKNSIIKRLRLIKQRDPRIHSIYIRHSAAHEDPKPIIADLDIAVFIRCNDLLRYSSLAKEIQKKIRMGTAPRLLPLEIIVLPASKDIFRLVRERYFFRSHYPFTHWRNIESESDLAPAPISYTYPFDHSSELAMDYFLLPRILKVRKPRLFEGAFLRRKIAKRVQQSSETKKFSQSHALLPFDQYLQLEINHAEQLFKSFKVEEKQTPLQTEDIPAFNVKKAVSDLGLIIQKNNLSAIQNVHFYQHCFLDIPAYVAFETAPEALPRDVVTSLQTIQRHFPLDRYTVLLGGHATSLGRLSYLSRNHFLEPYLYQHNGISIFSNYKLPVVLPDIEAIRAKFEESLLCTMIAVSDGGMPGYKLYKLIFTIHAALEYHRLMFSEDRLRQLYKNTFMAQNVYHSENILTAFFNALHGLFNIKLFESTMSQPIHE